MSALAAQMDSEHACSFSRHGGMHHRFLIKRLCMVIVCSDIHCLEAIQGIVERRAGGETGVLWLEALKGDEVWEAMRLGSWQAGGWSTELFDACLCRSLSLLPNGGDNPAGPGDYRPGGPEAARIEARAKKGALPGELETRLFIPCMPPAKSDSPGFSHTMQVRQT